MPTKLPAQRIDFDSKDSDLVEVPIGDCQIGKWRAVLNWEYDNELYVHQKEFEVKYI